MPGEDSSRRPTGHHEHISAPDEEERRQRLGLQRAWMGQAGAICGVQTPNMEALAGSAVRAACYGQISRDSVAWCYFSRYEYFTI